MGNPHFYYHPVVGGNLVSIDLGEGLSDIQELPGAVVGDAYGGEGQFSRHHHAAPFRVRIILERFGVVGAVKRERQLKTLANHLRRGGAVAFSADHDRTWAATLIGSPPQGTTLWHAPSNALAGLSSAGALVSGDEVVLESPYPEAQREVLLTATLPSPLAYLSLDEPTNFAYTGTVHARWRDCYPVLRLPADQVGKPIVTHDHRRNYTLDVTLEYDLAAVLGLDQPQQGQGLDVGGILEQGRFDRDPLWRP